MKSELQDVMSINLITAGMNDRLEDAYAVMRSNNVRHLPVINRKGEVVGIISDRDFQRAMNSDSPEVIDFGYNTIVRDFMNSPALTIPHDTELIVVVRKMIDEKISSLLISADDTIIGIISHEDLLRVLEAQLQPMTQKAIDKLSGWVATTPIGDVARRLSEIGI